ncbi:hypothetical protein BIV57_22695 [Mangrovactinospora gilvigrisea]|uniref:Uncharacterized protein n=1 Tax=Mangrovactinospora gilvigrisea TaxID=1428644 RepID=A0A1J7BP53_9ACTN|nr:hypothetical protein BIV57_22695 [Mangrovactinospora gilvigrisea]
MLVVSERWGRLWSGRRQPQVGLGLVGFVGELGDCGEGVEAGAKQVGSHAFGGLVRGVLEGVAVEMPLVQALQKPQRGVQLLGRVAGGLLGG